MKSLLLILLLIFFLGCVAQPKQEPSIQPELTPGIGTTESPAPTPIEKPVATPTLAPPETFQPEKPVEIKLTFPSGTIEKNNTYFLGDSEEAFTFEVEPADAEVLLNDTQLEVINGKFVVSKEEGERFELRVRKGLAMKKFNVVIGHGKLKAEWIKTGITVINDTYAYIQPDRYCEGIGKFRIYFEDGTPVAFRELQVRSVRSKTIWDNNLTTNEIGLGNFSVVSDRSWNLEFVDKKTNKTLLRALYEGCREIV